MVIFRACIRASQLSRKARTKGDNDSTNDQGDKEQNSVAGQIVSDKQRCDGYCHSLESQDFDQSRDIPRDGWSRRRKGVDSSTGAGILITHPILIQEGVNFLRKIFE